MSVCVVLVYLNVVSTGILFLLVRVRVFTGFRLSSFLFIWDSLYMLFQYSKKSNFSCNWMLRFLHIIVDTFIDDLQIFRLICTCDDIYYQETSVIRAYYRWFLIWPWQILDKHTIVDMFYLKWTRISPLRLRFDITWEIHSS